MASISNMSIWATENGGSSWYSPNPTAWYIDSNGAKYGVCYSFTVTPTSGRKITSISFTPPLRKDGSGDGYIATTGYFTAYLYKGTSTPSGSALASSYKESEIHYLEYRYPTFTFTIPDSIKITTATTFCVYVTGTWCLGYSGASASVGEQSMGIVHIDNGSSFNEYSIYIDNGSSWDLYQAYVDNGSSWDLIG